ncbi:MAG: AbrB/MazE/SpoVT family DNA-binding domain-containing protein [Defluviitaleaceae bacterium]|nr:AbrB/MazE/SpoVT family DNA-binding domain-containing protein [Defluviitaleaceae bacterium]
MRALATTSLKQWGDSTAVRIPQEALEQSHLQETDTLDVFVSNGVIMLQKQGKRKYSDIVKPLFDTSDWKFDREEANER